MEKDDLEVVAKFEGDFYSVRIYGSWDTGSWSWGIGIAKNMRIVYDPIFDRQVLRYHFQSILPSSTGDWRNCSVSHYPPEPHNERNIIPPYVDFKSALGLSFLASHFGIYETLDQAKAFVVSEIEKGQSLLAKRQQAALDKINSLANLITDRSSGLYR